MSAAHEDDSDTTDDAEKSSYSFLGRSILFLIIAGPASVFAFGIYARIGLKASVTAAAEKGDNTMMIIFALWLLGMLSTAFMIYKK